MNQKTKGFTGDKKFISSFKDTAPRANVIVSSANPNHKTYNGNSFKQSRDKPDQQKTTFAFRNVRNTGNDDDEGGIFLPTKDSLMAGTTGISETQVQANSWETWDTREVVQIKAPEKPEEMIGGMMQFTVNNARVKDIEKDNDVYEPENEDTPDLLEVIKLEEQRNLKKQTDKKSVDLKPSELEAEEKVQQKTIQQEQQRYGQESQGQYYPKQRDGYQPGNNNPRPNNGNNNFNNNNYYKNNSAAQVERSQNFSNNEMQKPQRVSNNYIPKGRTTEERRPYQGNNSNGFRKQQANERNQDNNNYNEQNQQQENGEKGMFVVNKNRVIYDDAPPRDQPQREPQRIKENKNRYPKAGRQQEFVYVPKNQC